MNLVIDLFSEDKAIEAFANFFGLIAGAVVLWNLGRFLWQFARSIYHNNVAIAWRRFRRKNAKLAVSSARDLHLFCSRIALITVSIILACTGILTSVISVAARNDANMRERFSDQKLFSNFETYKSVTNGIEAAGASSLMAMLLFSVFLLLTLIGAVQRLRNRWRRRGRSL